MSFNPLTHASRHLLWSELACHDQATTPYPLEWRADRLVLVIIAFEAVRAECCLELGADCPLDVLSGYRTPAYNLSLPPVFKAAPLSQHTQGRAVDGKAKFLSYVRFKKCVIRAANRAASPIKFIELRPKMGYVHWDTRPGDTLTIVTIL